MYRLVNYREKHYKEVCDIIIAGNMELWSVAYKQVCIMLELINPAQP